MTSSIRTALFEIQLGITDARDSMHKKEHPHYGNGIRAMHILETKGARLLEHIPVLEAWMREYEAGRAWLWIQSLLEEGTRRVEKYKHWSAWSSVPPVPCMGSMEAWALVEKAYEGALDVRFSVALQGAYQAACRFSEKPFHHEGECWGGLVCMACEGDEWTWIQQCLD